MKRFKLMTLGLLVCTSFVAGQMFAPNANTATGGTNEDPVVSKTFLNAELGKLKSTITSLEKTITALEGNIKTLQSEVNKLQSSSGSSNSGSSNSGSSNSGSSSSGGSSSSSTTYIGKATVTATTLNVRSGAGTSYSTIGSLKKGDTVNVIKKSGGWYQIQFTSSKTGWVSADYVSYKANSNSSSNTTKTGVVTANSLNVRSGAGTSYSIVGSLSKNTKVEITQTSGSWYKIKSGSLVGWVSADYIKLS